MKLAVVGHVEWMDFLVVERLPVQGEIVHVASAHEGSGGGGAMAAYALRALDGACTLLCAVGDDPRGAEAVAYLRGAGIDVRAVVRPRPQRRGMTYLDADHERTITILGDRLVPYGDDHLPWEMLATCDGVYFTGGDAAALRASRAAKTVVATPRAREALLEAGVEVDALVGSSGDAGERIDGDLLAIARQVVQTEGPRGGAWRARDGGEGRWAASPLPGDPVDTYGCGDSFAAGVTYGLAAGLGIQRACEVGGRVGAAVLCRRAPAVGDLSAARRPG